MRGRLFERVPRALGSLDPGPFSPAPVVQVAGTPSLRARAPAGRGPSGSRQNLTRNVCFGDGAERTANVPFIGVGVWWVEVEETA